MVLLPDMECATCTEAQKLERGCSTPATKPVELGGEALLRCPRRVLLDDPVYYTELFWLHSNYSNGILATSGGLDDQPHKLMASIRLMITARQEAEREKDEREKRRQAFREKVARKFNPSG